MNDAKIIKTSNSDHNAQERVGEFPELEVWKSIKSFEGIYEVNTSGDIRSLTRAIQVNGSSRVIGGRVLKQKVGKNGYLAVRLSKDGENSTKYAHRIFAEAFITTPFNKPIVNHINGDKLDNRIENLEWVSHSENMKHAYRLGLSHGKNNRRLIDAYSGKEFNSIREASDFLSVNYSTCRGYLRRNRRNRTCLRYKS